jgi:hypothetical protein
MPTMLAKAAYILKNERVFDEPEHFKEVHHTFSVHNSEGQIMENVTMNIEQANAVLMGGVQLLTAAEYHRKFIA